MSDALKRSAAEAAVVLVEDGMRVGLGTGSTAAFVVAALGRRVAAGLSIRAVPTSEATALAAAAAGIPLDTLDDGRELDLTIDGADEIDPALRLIKGGGGALLREKMVATFSRRMVVVADETKQVAQLGRFPLPIEVVRFGLETTRRRVQSTIEDVEGAAGELVLRRDAAGQPFVTDGGNAIIDAHLGAIGDAHGLAVALKGVLGVVEHGLFVGLADTALIGTQGGVMEVRAGAAVAAPPSEGRIG